MATRPPSTYCGQWTACATLSLKRGIALHLQLLQSAIAALMSGAFAGPVSSVMYSDCVCRVVLCIRFITFKGEARVLPHTRPVRSLPPRRTARIRGADRPCAWTVGVAQGRCCVALHGCGKPSDTRSRGLCQGPVQRAAWKDGLGDRDRPLSYRVRLQATDRPRASMISVAQGAAHCSSHGQVR